MKEKAKTIKCDKHSIFNGRGTLVLVQLSHQCLVTHPRDWITIPLVSLRTILNCCTDPSWSAEPSLGTVSPCSARYVVCLYMTVYRSSASRSTITSAIDKELVRTFIIKVCAWCWCNASNGRFQHLDLWHERPRCGNSEECYSSRGKGGDHPWQRGLHNGRHELSGRLHPCTRKKL